MSEYQNTRRDPCRGATRGPAIAGTVAFFTSGGNPVAAGYAAISAASSAAVLQNTGEGRQLVGKIAQEVFVDILHMNPKYAYMASYITLNAGITSGLEAGINWATGAEKLTNAGIASRPIQTGSNGDWVNSPGVPVSYDFWANQGMGGLSTGGGNLDSILSGGGKVYALVNKQGEVAALYGAGPAFMPGMNWFGLDHTAAVVRGADGVFHTSLTGFSGGNIYLATAVCHQMTNQAFWTAGFANTVTSLSGSGFFSNISQLIYGNYGNGAGILGYQEAEKNY